MWIIFGWEKIEQPLGDIGSAHCFDCQRESKWMVWNTSEWVTFSALRIFRFIHRHELQCNSCSSTLALHASEYRRIHRHMQTYESINGSAIHFALANRIEKQQLAEKTPLQLRFIKASMKARQEYREKMAAQEKTL